MSGVVDNAFTVVTGTPISKFSLMLALYTSIENLGALESTMWTAIEAVLLRGGSPWSTTCTTIVTIEPSCRSPIETINDITPVTASIVNTFEGFCNME